MGDFLIKIEATGGHGCQRQLGTGDTVGNCGQPNCPDCAVRELVDKLKQQGVMLRSASLTHWPGTDGQVVDDLLSGVRQGNFPEKGPVADEGPIPPTGGGPPNP